MCALFRTWTRITNLWIAYFLVGCTTTSTSSHPHSEPKAESPSSFTTPPGGLDTTITEREATPWGQLLERNRYQLINNEWNAQAARGSHYQDIFRGSDSKGGFIGWSWHWKGGSNVVAYPEVECGASPWNAPLGLAPEFPLQVGSKKLTAHLDINLDARGVYDLSFDLWGISSLPSTKENITYEIMIWVVDQAPSNWSWATKVGTVTVADTNFTVYQRLHHGDDSHANSNHWTYLAFVPKTPFLKGDLPLDSFLSWLVAHDLLAPSTLIADVGFGTEVWTGSGKVKLYDYAIRVE